MSWRDQVKAIARRAGYEISRLSRTGSVVPGISHETIRPSATYAPWRDDREFQDTYALLRSRTALDLYRMYSLWQLAEQVRPIQGHFLEVGVWRGGSGLLLAKRAESQRIDDLHGKVTYLADTWAGVVKTGPKDPEYRGGEFRDVSLEELKEYQRARFPKSRVHYLRGIFPEESAGYLTTGEQMFCLVHLDLDSYQSTVDAFEYIWPRVLPGGVVVFDDYGFLGTEGPILAINERRHLPGRLTVHTLAGQAVMLKTVGPNEGGWA